VDGAEQPVDLFARVVDSIVDRAEPLVRHVEPLGDRVELV
jgi:hypothetical protein